MTQIYKITNILNGKIYIGKTMDNYIERWHQHCREMLRERCEKRPLYSAMRKYGVESFKIELIESIDDNIGSEREKYWIEYYQSFKAGYNATTGGDGKPYIDRDLVVAVYQQLKNMSKTARQLHISVDSVASILKSNNILTLSGPAVLSQKIIHMFDKNGECLRTFSSYRQAADFLKDTNPTVHSGYTTISKRIKEVCKGERKTAYQYKWSYFINERRVI